MSKKLNCPECHVDWIEENEDSLAKGQISRICDECSVTMKGRELNTHLSHCFQGEYINSCKYGEEECPAQKVQHTIYRDFNHWFSHSEAHGMSSASRDWMQDIWNDLLPTMEANLDNHKMAFLELSKETAEHRSKITDALMDYVDMIREKHPELPKFWRWWLDQELEEE